MNSRQATGTLALALAITACGNDPASLPGPASIEVLSGPPAAGSPGAFLIDTLRVRLIDDEGVPRAGEPITWTVLQGGGLVVPLGATTDASGIARARWRLGAVSGLNRVRVSSTEDTSQVFQALGEAFRVDRLDSHYGGACGLRSGDLWCWGNIPGPGGVPVSLLEPPFDLFPVDAPGLLAQGQGYTDLAVGWLRVCAIGNAGRVDCYGSAGVTNPAVPMMHRIAGGDSYLFCGLTLADSTAWCWDMVAGTAAPLENSPRMLSIEMEAGLGEPYTACGLAADSTAFCWGLGPLGNGTFDSSATAVPVDGGRKYIELALGDEFGCGLEPDGDVWCWGRNQDGQLGNVGPDQASPIFVTSGVTRIAAALRTVLAIRYGRVVRWGFFGFNGGSNPITPLASVNHLPVIDLAANDISCLRLADGQVYCFDELWVNSSTVDIDRYAPVQPVN